LPAAFPPKSTSKRTDRDRIEPASGVFRAQEHAGLRFNHRSAPFFIALLGNV